MPYTQDEIGEPEEKKQAVEAEVVKQAKPAKPSDPEIPQDVLTALEACTTSEMLLETCRAVVKAKGDQYRAVLQQYYNEHKGKLGA